MGSTYFRVMYCPAGEHGWRFISSYGCSPGQAYSMGAGGSHDLIRATQREGIDYLEIRTGPENDAPYYLPAGFAGSKRWPLYRPGEEG